MVINALSIVQNRYFWYFPNFISGTPYLSNLNLVNIENCDKNSGAAEHLPVLLYHQNTYNASHTIYALNHYFAGQHN